MSIHSGYAFERDLAQKSFDNAEAYKQIPKGKYTSVKYIPGYNSFEKIIRCDEPFLPIEMLLWADDGNLCFGGTFNGGRDNINQMVPAGEYRVRIFTD